MGQVCRAVGVCLAVLGFLALHSFSTGAASGVRVDEAACRIDWRNGACVLSLAIENPTGKSVSARIALDIVSPSNSIEASNTFDAKLVPGNQVIETRLAFPAADSSDKVMWHRLRYRIVTGTPFEGIVSLSQISPGLFDLRMTTPNAVPTTGHFQAVVSALHPITGKGLRGRDGRQWPVCVGTASRREIRGTFRGGRVHGDGFSRSIRFGRSKPPT